MAGYLRTLEFLRGSERNLRRWALDPPTAMGTCFKQRNPASIYMLKFHENLCWGKKQSKGLLLKEFKEHSSPFKLCNDFNLYCLIGLETRIKCRVTLHEKLKLNT